MTTRQSASNGSSPYRSLEWTEESDYPPHVHLVAGPPSAIAPAHTNCLAEPANWGPGEPGTDDLPLARKDHGRKMTPMTDTGSMVLEAALATTFASLVRPVEMDPSAAGSTHPAVEIAGGDLESYPEGIYVQATAMLGARRMAQAALLLRRLGAITAHQTDELRWRRRTDFLWAVYAQQTGDLAAMLEHCRAAGDHVLAQPSTQCANDIPSGGSLLATIDAVVADQLPLLTARAHIGLGQPEYAEAVLLERYGTREQAEASQPATMAMLACRRGRLGDAMRLATLALEVAERQDAAGELVDLEARLVLAEVFVERNQLDAAWRQLQTALRLFWLSGATSRMWAIEIDLARVLVSQGRAGEAVHRLENLRAVGAGFLSQRLLQKLNQLSIDCFLELGDLEGAILFAKSVLPQDIPSQTLARLDLCSGRPDRAIARLNAAGSSDVAAEIRRLVLRACAEKQRGHLDDAQDAIRRAVELARSDRYVRPFLEQATQTLPLLRGVTASSRDAYVRELICEAERLTGTPGSGRTAPVLEPLTERELQILHHLPSHLTLRQIASALCVSTNTVKTHVKAIYRKTGVISRHEAVTVARQHGLL